MKWNILYRYEPIWDGEQFDSFEIRTTVEVNTEDASELVGRVWEDKSKAGSRITILEAKR